VFGKQDGQRNKVKLAFLYQYRAPDTTRHRAWFSFDSDGSVLDKSNLLSGDLFDPPSNVVLGFTAIVLQVRLDLDSFS
jgi:hypothetical protein